MIHPYHASIHITFAYVANMSDFQLTREMSYLHSMGILESTNPLDKIMVFALGAEAVKRLKPRPPRKAVERFSKRHTSITILIFPDTISIAG